jgi:hypothetical protein
MSLPNFIQDNLEFLIEELDTRASQQLMANGHVEDRLLDIINGLESFLPAPVEAPAPVVVDTPADPVVETPEAVAAFMADEPHEQFTHPEDVIETEEIK